MKKEGYIILFIGKMGCGKTPYVKKLVESNHLRRLVADVRKEYPVTYSRQYINNADDYDAFMRTAERATNTNIIIEEGTAFFNGYNEKELMLFVTGIQHNHCIGYFCFHSIRKTPTALIDLAKYIVLWDTGESRRNIKKKDERFLNYLFDKKPTVINKNSKRWNEPDEDKHEVKLNRNFDAVKDNSTGATSRMLNYGELKNKKD